MTIDKQYIYERVTDIFRKATADDNIKHNTDFINEYGVDSLDCIELNMELEKVFDISLEDVMFYNLRTIDNVVKAIIERIEKKGVVVV